MRSLEGKHVRLDRMTADHIDPLWEAGQDPSIWQWSPFPVDTPEAMKDYVLSALAEETEGSALPFVTVWKDRDAIVGSTRFGNIDRPNRRVEIGWTWLHPSAQRTVVNTEAKFLMLEHAFEKMDCIRVEFKTDSLNEKSRKAMERIGCQYEGTLRNHMVTATERLRHSAYFSILAEEWPGVRKNLQSMLERG